MIKKKGTQIYYGKSDLFTLASSRLSDSGEDAKIKGTR